MTLTKEEIEWLKIVFKFPLEFEDRNKTRIVSFYGTGKYVPFLYLTDGVLDESTIEFREEILNILNGNSNRVFKVKNIKLKLSDTNNIYLNKFHFCSLANVRTFETRFKIDFIKANSINRTYTEYVMEKLKYAFNDKS